MAMQDLSDAEEAIFAVAEEPRPSSRKGRVLTIAAALVVGSALVGVAVFAGSMEKSRISTSNFHKGSGINVVGIRRLDEELVIPEEVFLDVNVWDFKSSHPDFENPDRSVHGLRPGLVESTLGHDGKPVYKDGQSGVIHSADSFRQWYSDDNSVNRRVGVSLKFERQGDENSKTLVYDSGDPADATLGFFPIDGQGWGDSATNPVSGTKHNYWFTMALKHEFVYHGGETFKFRGDDDLWVFVNDKLVLDLGGRHEPAEGEVILDTLGLTKEEHAQLHLFYAERHTYGSNFRVETNIDFLIYSHKCCFIKVGPVQWICEEQYKKSWYHWMC